MKEHNRHSYEVTAEYLMKEYDDDIENDDAFNIEFLMERFLRDIGA